MGQHYVPQFYLKGFCETSDASLIWVYEKGSNRVFSSPVRTIANKKKLWPQKIEDYLTNEVENPANLVLEKIRTHKAPTLHEKEILSAYMIVLLRRVPNGWERTKSHVPEFFDNLNEHILGLMKENPAKIEILKQRQQQIKEIRPKFEKELPRELWYNYLQPDYTPQTLATLPQMKWTFLTADRKQNFLTNDNPVFFFTNMGIGRPESEFTFPISSTIALLATWRTNLGENFRPATDAEIIQINRRTASNASRFIFCCQQSAWIINLVNRKDPQLHLMA